ncbi:amidase [Cupriavidus basilensis]|uniref:Amidase n=1 Tax=Cupriavidus basilensis TaxID=68895 RepID=A0A643FKG4_9BURK|nr:amidase family protein [Cupriavidus basilensis]QOT82049.1 amidase [Cupriavidus basilensis]
MKLSEYLLHDGLALAMLVREKEVRPIELLECAVEQMLRVQPFINAVCWEELDMARTVAFSMEQSPVRGSFAGVPMLVKDIMLAVSGFRLTNGSRLFAGVRCEHDSELAARLRRAGFNFFGRTTTPEFGANCTTESPAYGAPTRNPWDTDYSSGGSSGGAAAAVAAGILPVAHASDGGGSIRIPAACCGLFGLKPTKMRNPLGPVAGEGWGGMSVEHVVSRSVRDSAAVLDATHGADLGAPYAAPAYMGKYLAELERPLQPLRIGLILDSPSGAPVHQDCIAAVEDAARLCEGLGHQVEHVTLPDLDFEAFGHAMRLIVAAGTSQAVRVGSASLGVRPSLESLEISSFTSVDFALRHSAADYADAIARMHQVGRRLGTFMESYDVLLTPTLTTPPARIGRYAADRDYVTHRTDTLLYTAFLPYFNASGQPAMSVPLFWNENGLPIGVQFVGRLGREDILFRLAGQLERARPWFDRLSPLALPPQAG